MRWQNRACHITASLHCITGRPSDHYFLPSSKLEHQVLLCDGVIAAPSGPNHFLKMDPQSCQPPIQHPRQATSVTSAASSQTEESSLPFSASEAHRPPPSNMKTGRERTQLGGIMWSEAASTVPAGRQRSERPDIMLMEAFGWFLHDFTPHCLSQLSDTVTAAQWDACNLYKAEKKHSQRY